MKFGAPAPVNRGRLRIRKDCCQWLIDFMSNCTREFSQRSNTHQVRYFLTLQFKIGLSSFLIRDVGEHPAELAWCPLSIDI